MFLRQPGLVFYALEAEKHTYLALPTAFQGPVPTQGRCFPAGLLLGLRAGSQCPPRGLHSYLITWKNTTLPWEANRPHSLEGVLCPAGVDLSRNTGLWSHTVPRPPGGSLTVPWPGLRVLIGEVALGWMLAGLRKRGRTTPRMCPQHKCSVTGRDVSRSLTRCCFHCGEIQISNFTILTIF